MTGDSIAPHEKFDYCAWRPGPGGAPILEGCDWLAGRVLERIDGGDHVIHILDIAETAQRARAGAATRFESRRATSSPDTDPKEHR